MPTKKYKIINSALSFPLIILLVSSGDLYSKEAESKKYEVPGEISASSIFSKKLLKGPHHKINEEVVTYNGFTNHFIIQSDFGRLKATGNGMVPVRIQEINAIAKMAEMKKSGAFVDGLKESGGTLLESGKNLIVHPVDTLSGFPSGVYNIFADIGVVARKVVKREASIADATVKAGDALLGFSRNKHELAYSLGVNQFSDNKVLHEYLNSVSWATTGGTFTVDLGKMAVSGPAGAVLTVASSTRTLNRMMRDNTIPGLQRINEDTLETIGISKSVIDRFLGNRKLTPRHQTSITQSIALLTQAKKLPAFLNLVSMKTRSIDDANMHQAVAAMIAGYNRTQSPITEVRTFENIVIFRNKKGSYVITYPMDNFFWTKRTAAKTIKVSAALPSGVKKELWISGNFSKLASHKLKELGWVLKGQSLKNLNVGNPY